jgi:NADP-dependent 3-hydroxy acid dehydrogenase YdfG
MTGFHPGLGYRTALVTGASSGIGAAMVRHLAAAGLTVHAVARRADRLQALAKSTGCIPYTLDITDRAACTAAFADLEVDILVNNAGASFRAALQDYPPDEIDRVLDLNLRAVMQMTRLLLPGMLRRDRGHVVVVGSMAGHYPMAGSALYSAAKAAVSHAFDVLRLDTLGSRIRWTEVAPGRVATEAFTNSMGDTPEAKAFLARETLTPDDMAATIAFALQAPPHVNISRVEIYPVKQASGGFVYAD